MIELDFEVKVVSGFEVGAALDFELTDEGGALADEECAPTDVGRIEVGEVGVDGALPAVSP